MTSEEDFFIWQRNTILLLFLQERIDNEIRNKICKRCSEEQKKLRGCISRSGDRTFCKLLVKKRKQVKRLKELWIMDTLMSSPYIKESEFISKVANSFYLREIT
jgi:hypothetical protein